MLSHHNSLSASEFFETMPPQLKGSSYFASATQLARAKGSMLIVADKPYQDYVAWLPVLIGKADERNRTAVTMPIAATEEDKKSVKDTDWDRLIQPRKMLPIYWVDNVTEEDRPLYIQPCAFRMGSYLYRAIEATCNADPNPSGVEPHPDSFVGMLRSQLKLVPERGLNDSLRNASVFCMTETPAASHPIGRFGVNYLGNYELPHEFQAHVKPYQWYVNQLPDAKLKWTELRRLVDIGQITLNKDKIENTPYPNSREGSWKKFFESE